MRRETFVGEDLWLCSIRVDSDKYYRIIDTVRKIGLNVIPDRYHRIALEIQERLQCN